MNEQYTYIEIRKTGPSSFEIYDNTSPNTPVFSSDYDGLLDPNNRFSMPGGIQNNDATLTITKKTGQPIYNHQPWNIFRYVDATNSANNFIPTSAIDLQRKLILRGFYSENNVVIPPDIIDQDNIDRIKGFRYPMNTVLTDQDVVNQLNAVTTWTISEKESYYFRGTQYQNNANNFPVPTGNTLLYKMINKGKGTYGVNGVPLTTSDIVLVDRQMVTAQDIENDPTTDIVEYELAEGQTISQWLNTQNPAITIKPVDEGYTLFKSEGQTTYLFVGDSGTYGTGESQSTDADFESFSNEIPSGGLQSVGGYGVDNTDPQNPVIQNIQDLPEDFFVAGSANTTTSETRARLNYLTDTFRFIDLRPYVNNYPVSDSNEVVRNGNDLYVMGRVVISGQTPSAPNFIVWLKTKIIDNVLTVLYSEYQILDTGTDAGGTNAIRLHGSFYLDGFVYISTRPNSTTIPNRLFKINANKLSDIDTFTFPASENLRNFNEIKVYKNYIYTFALTSATTPQVIKLVRIDTDFREYKILNTYPVSTTTGGINIQGDPTFSIYNDKIYIMYYPSPVSNGNRYIGLLELDLNGNILRTSQAFDLGEATGSMIPHWCTVFNGKFIVHTAIASNTNRKLIRIDIPQMKLEEFITLPEALTDDNAMMPNGSIYLSSESSNTGNLYKLNNYKDFTTLTIVLTPWRSAGVLQYYYQIEGLKTNLSQFKNDLQNQTLVLPLVTQSSGDTIQNDVLIGSQVLLIFKNNFATQADQISFNSATGTITNFPYDANETILIIYTKI